MKKVFILFIVLLFFPICSCAKNNGSNKFVSRLDDFTYYEKLMLSSDKHLFVYGNDYRWKFQEIIIGEAIQGLFARDNGQFYYLEYQSKPYTTWLNDLKEKCGFTIEEVNFDRTIELYLNAYSNMKQYILYDVNKKQSVNVATSLSGIYGALPITEEYVSKFESLGFNMFLDVSDKTESWCFDNYSNQFNNSGAVQLRGDIPHLRDYAIACKYFCFYPDDTKSSTIAFRGKVQQWIKDDAPIFGWGPFSEDSHVGISSQNGQFTIPSDYCYNLSVFASSNILAKKTFDYTRSNELITAEQGKHYVCITRSDGDNIQTWFNYFSFSEKDMAASRGDFPIGWTIQPSLVDLAPTILDYVYRNIKENDYFVCGVSGQGYMYPQNYPCLQSFVEGLGVYLRKADLDIVQILDSGPSNEVIEAYSQIPELKGGMYLYGNKYMGGNGRIYWSNNGKPFVSCRESLWGALPKDVASRINTYSTDPTSEEGYTLLNLHPWSMSYQDIIEMQSYLNENVVFVTPEQFIDLITKNVKH